MHRLLMSTPLSRPLFVFLLSATAATAGMEYKEIPGESLALENNGQVLWQFHYGKSAPNRFSIHCARWMGTS